tara:strand:- start:4199 stop:4420 length:222 start_codon:yes stop_codon:yes gene_type:complete
MTTREEATKMRKKLVRAERILAQQEKAKAARPDFMPMQLKKEKDRPEPKTADVPNVIHLPKKRKAKKENVPFW